MSVRAISTHKAPAAVGPYSQAVASGDVIYSAAQIGIDPATGKLVEGGAGPQTERIMKNIAAILAAAGSDLSQVLKTTIFIVDMADLAALNEAYGRAFGNHRPARSLAQVTALPREAKVEIECIAVLRL